MHSAFGILLSAGSDQEAEYIGTLGPQSTSGREVLGFGKQFFFALAWSLLHYFLEKNFLSGQSYELLPCPPLSTDVLAVNPNGKQGLWKHLSEHPRVEPF